MPEELLAHTISISGPDAVTFAHAQFSSHVSSLEVGQWQFSAWLDARGRVRSLFHLARCEDDTLVLLLRGGNAAKLVTDLRKFVFRARVSIMAADPCLLSAGSAMQLHFVHCAPDGMSLGCGDYRMDVVREGTVDQAWRLLQLRAGWPWLPDSALDRWLAPALSLRRLQAVVTDKGCYPGQEIVARLHFRGRQKQQLCRITLSGEIRSGKLLELPDTYADCLLDSVCTEAQVEALAVLDDATLSSFINGRLDVHEVNASIRLCDSWPD